MLHHIAGLIEWWKSVLRSELGDDPLWGWDTILIHAVYSLNQWSLYGTLSSLHRIPESRMQGVEIGVTPLLWLQVTWGICVLHICRFRGPHSHREVLPLGNCWCLVTLDLSCQETNSKKRDDFSRITNPDYQEERELPSHKKHREECSVLMWSTWVSLDTSLPTLIINEVKQHKLRKTW